jgi:hypothetical protein
MRKKSIIINKCKIGRGNIKMMIIYIPWYDMIWYDMIEEEDRDWVWELGEWKEWSKSN